MILQKTKNFPKNQNFQISYILCMYQINENAKQGIFPNSGSLYFKRKIYIAIILEFISQILDIFMNGD